MNVEIKSGLRNGDIVFVLPSKGLVERQERFRNRVNKSWGQFLLIFSEILFTSLSSLKSNPVRSFLTALAIIIGIGSVIAMLSIGSGAQKLLEEEIQTLGGRILWVSGSQRVRGGVKRDYVQLEIKDPF